MGHAKATMGETNRPRSMHLHSFMICMLLIYKHIYSVNITHCNSHWTTNPLDGVTIHFVFEQILLSQ